MITLDLVLLLVRPRLASVELIRNEYSKSKHKKTLAFMSNICVERFNGVNGTVIVIPYTTRAC